MLGCTHPMVVAAGPAHDERLRRRTPAEAATLGQAAAADEVTVDQASPATGQPCDGKREHHSSRSYLEEAPWRLSSMCQSLAAWSPSFKHLHLGHDMVAGAASVKFEL